jgi:hypothetical protein
VKLIEFESLLQEDSMEREEKHSGKSKKEKSFTRG